MRKGRRERIDKWSRERREREREREKRQKGTEMTICREEGGTSTLASAWLSFL